MTILAAAAFSAAIMNNTEAEKSIHDFTMYSIKSEATPLKKYKGKVLLVVNTASKCGLTPQYKGLQSLYDSKKKEGLVVLGFPANNFGNQEPGSDKEISAFCTENYGVTFPMFSKISVKGDDIHPLYKWLINATDKQGDIKWNFAKFVIGKDGQVAARFSPQTKPDNKKLLAAIDAALAK
jgi:glutathione peroxidase